MKAELFLCIVSFGYCFRWKISLFECLNVVLALTLKSTYTACTCSVHALWPRVACTCTCTKHSLAPLLPPSLFLGSYDEVEVTNFTTSWRDGLAFCAIIDRHRPDLLSYDDCLGQQPLENIETAFRVAEEKLGIIKIVDPEGEPPHTLK